MAIRKQKPGRAAAILAVLLACGSAMGCGDDGSSAMDGSLGDGDGDIYDDGPLFDVCTEDSELTVTNVVAEGIDDRLSDAMLPYIHVIYAPEGSAATEQLAFYIALTQSDDLEDVADEDSIFTSATAYAPAATGTESWGSETAFLTSLGQYTDGDVVGVDIPILQVTDLEISWSAAELAVGETLTGTLQMTVRTVAYQAEGSLVIDAEFTTPINPFVLPEENPCSLAAVGGEWAIEGSIGALDASIDGSPAFDSHRAFYVVEQDTLAIGATYDDWTGAGEAPELGLQVTEPAAGENQGLVRYTDADGCVFGSAAPDLGGIMVTDANGGPLNDGPLQVDFRGVLEAVSPDACPPRVTVDLSATVGTFRPGI